jgi:predicted HNH restriction endonuclease
VIPVSKLRKTDKTKLSDIAMVCSNCHRMLHREPWLTVETLQDLITKISATQC